ncbi:hypothetical protein [Sinobaca sp. H24]|uniref:hypothetical protein n=1 Tax=Sinobaca sp. H24 TaxID=2923376 RepID=UPI00207A5ED2|nr:hypothetical protein [Sinobaca sp. H24]
MDPSIHQFSCRCANILMACIDSFLHHIAGLTAGFYIGSLLTAKRSIKKERALREKPGTYAQKRNTVLLAAVLSIVFAVTIIRFFMLI